MAIRIQNNGSVVLTERDVDILRTFNGDQLNLLSELIDLTEPFYGPVYVPVILRIDHIKFSGPATIIFWKDGTKTIVKCTEEEEFNCETGIAMATLKKILGSDYVSYKKKVKKIVDEQTKKDLDTLSKEIAESIKEGRVNKVVEQTKKNLGTLSKEGRVSKDEEEQS